MSEKSGGIDRRTVLKAGAVAGFLGVVAGGGWLVKKAVDHVFDPPEDTAICDPNAVDAANSSAAEGPEGPPTEAEAQAAEMKEEVRRILGTDDECPTTDIPEVPTESGLRELLINKYIDQTGVFTPASGPHSLDDILTAHNQRFILIYNSKMMQMDGELNKGIALEIRYDKSQRAWVYTDPKFAKRKVKFLPGDIIAMPGNNMTYLPMTHSPIITRHKASKHDTTRKREATTRKFEEVLREVLAVVQEGDIIIHTSRSAQSKLIQKAFNHPATHNGVVMKIKGVWVVYEAVQPVRIVPLANWILNSKPGDSTGFKLEPDYKPWVALNRHKDLTPGEIANMKRHLDGELGKPYDVLFRPDQRNKYCSELVDDTAEAVGRNAGKDQSLGDLRLGSRGLLVLSRRYCRSSGDACRDVEGNLTQKLKQFIVRQFKTNKVTTKEFFAPGFRKGLDDEDRELYDTILDEIPPGLREYLTKNVVVTPASQLDDPNLQHVYRSRPDIHP